MVEELSQLLFFPRPQCVRGKAQANVHLRTLYFSFVGSAVLVFDPSNPFCDVEVGSPGGLLDVVG